MKKWPVQKALSRVDWGAISMRFLTASTAQAQQPSKPPWVWELAAVRRQLKGAQFIKANKAQKHLSEK